MIDPLIFGTDFFILSMQGNSNNASHRLFGEQIMLSGPLRSELITSSSRLCVFYLFRICGISILQGIQVSGGDQGMLKYSLCCYADMNVEFVALAFEDVLLYTGILCLILLAVHEPKSLVRFAWQNAMLSYYPASVFCFALEYCA